MKEYKSKKDVDKDYLSKNIQVKLTFSKADYDKLYARYEASKSTKSLNKWINQMALNGKISVNKQVQLDQKDRRLIIKIGTLLNQIAMKVNSIKSDKVSVTKVENDLKQIKNELVSIQNKAVQNQ